VTAWLVPDPTRGDSAAVAARLGVLAAWRRGARIAVCVGPAAAVVGLLAGEVATVVLAAAAFLAAATEMCARAALRRSALRGELGDVPAVARRRARLSDVAHRRRLAAELRRTACHCARSPREQSRRVYAYERLADTRHDLMRLADAVLAAEHADPAVLADITMLLRDGNRSALLNAAIPAEELRVALRRARFLLETTAPRSEPPPAPPNAHTPVIPEPGGAPARAGTRRTSRGPVGRQS
jgi:hypothetical protein